MKELNPTKKTLMKYNILSTAITSDRNNMRSKGHDLLEKYPRLMDFNGNIAGFNKYYV